MNKILIFILTLILVATAVVFVIKANLRPNQEPRNDEVDAIPVSDEELDLTPEEEPLNEEQDRAGEGLNINEDTLNIVENPEEKQEQEEETVLTSCADIDFSGFWNLTTDLEDTSFTPPYANQNLEFHFSADGTVNFVENYQEPETGSWAEAKHEGRWSVNTNCGFIYNGTATGNGFDSVNNSPFTLYYAITATGQAVTANKVTGQWKSSESYQYANGDLITQVVYGTFEGTR